MGVSVGSVGVGERGIVISVAIAMVSIQTAVVQPWVSLRISISLGSGFGIGIGISLLPFRLNSRSFCNRSCSSSDRYVSKVRSLSTGDKFALAVLAPSGRGSVYYGSMGGSIH